MKYLFYVGILLTVFGGIWMAPVAIIWIALAPYSQPLNILLIGHSFIAIGSFLSGASLSLYARKSYNRKKKWIAKYSYLESLKNMPWEEFEDLVGEVFKNRGFEVDSKGGAQADGGIDLVVKKKNKKYLVQCKRYKGNVGVQVVREIFGVMVSEKFDGAYIMTSGTFTKEGLSFANGKSMRLIHGEELVKMLKSISAKY